MMNSLFEVIVERDAEIRKLRACIALLEKTLDRQKAEILRLRGHESFVGDAT